MDGLQIRIRLEEWRYSPGEAGAVSVPFRKALAYFKDNDVPFQIFSKASSTPALTQTARFVLNQVAWLMLVVAPVRSQPIHKST